jgi:hypothetical protein
MADNTKGIKPDVRVKKEATGSVKTKSTGKVFVHISDGQGISDPMGGVITRTMLAPTDLSQSASFQNLRSSTMKTAFSGLGEELMSLAICFIQKSAPQMSLKTFSVTCMILRPLSFDGFSIRSLEKIVSNRSLALTAKSFPDETINNLRISDAGGSVTLPVLIHSFAEGGIIIFPQQYAHVTSLLTVSHPS